MKQLLSTLMVSAMMIATPVAATAVAPPDVFGSATWLTARNCNGLASTVDCQAQPPGGYNLVESVRAGGAGLSTNATFHPAAGGSASSVITYGALGLPEIHATAFAGADNRINSNSVAYESFTYTGAAGTPFALTASLDFTSSGAPTYIANGKKAGAGEFGGEGFAYFQLALWSPSKVAGLVTAKDITDSVFAENCDISGVFGVVNGSFATNSAGPGGGSVTLATGCDGNPLVLNPGDQFLVVALIQTPANRGGYLDASHTFKVELAPTLSPEAIAALTAGIVSAAAVPEPSVWAQMIAGFALAGLAMRRRKAVAA